MALVSFQRKRRMSYGARGVNVVVDGHSVAVIQNGVDYEVEISAGEHILQFFVGKSCLAKYRLYIPDDRDSINVVFEAPATGGIEAFSANDGVLRECGHVKDNGFTASKKSSGIVLIIFTIIVASILLLGYTKFSLILGNDDSLTTNTVTPENVIYYFFGLIGKYWWLAIWVAIIIAVFPLMRIFGKNGKDDDGHSTFSSSNDKQNSIYSGDHILLLSTVDDMSGYDFERWCAELLRRNGFTNVSVTPGSNDQGIDVLANKDGLRYGIQCKCYSHDLGNRPVQEATTGRAVYKCDIAVVMTNRYFTKGAVEAANATGVWLWDRDKLAQMVKVAGKK